jgi:hypothetical protein
MRSHLRGGILAGSFAAAALQAVTASASSLDASGHLVFDSDALLSVGFESLSDAQAQGASWLSWNGQATALVATAVTTGDWASTAGTPGIVTLPSALEGTHALELTTGQEVALALVDTAFFKTLTSQRIQVSFWGLSMGAEPQLDIVYPSTNEPLGPNGFGHVVAVRTGRETSDGWAEYSTGPIDGQMFGNDPIAAIILTARFATDSGTYALDSFDLGPSYTSEILDTTAYALADAVEIEPAEGSPMPVTPCTQATATTACGSLGECNFGRCVDGSIVWGALPAAADHRSDLVNRWAFVAEHLGADRNAATNAPGIFSASAVSAVATATTSPAFFGGLNTLVNTIQDGHTGFGVSPSDGTAFFEALGASNSYSGSLDVCLGLAQDDLPGGTGGLVYSVFWVAPASVLAGAAATLLPGDMLTQVDGLAPDAWLDSVGARFRYALPNDPTSDPSGRAILLSRLLAKYASTAVFSSCTASGACTTKNVDVGAIVYGILTSNMYPAITTSSRLCTGRFTDSVSTWVEGNDYDDDQNDGRGDIPVVETSGGITSVEFDGFEWSYDSSDPSDPYHTWEDPMTSALTSGNSLLFDARLGHGGHFALGRFLTSRIRGTANPYFIFAVPRGTWDTIDPAWLFDPSLASCAITNSDAPDMCGWTGGDSDESTLSSPPAGSVKIAWLNGRDLSMNDIVPRGIQGAPNVRIFGPLPTSGAYGEISDIPAYVAGWSPGSTQVLDMRFGSSFSTAVAAPWGSGKGVVPDQVVGQNVSDILTGTDTVLTAAKAWLSE